MLWTLAPTLDGSGFLTFLEHPDSHTLWDGYDLAFRIIGSTTTAIAVPEPATVLPFLFALAGIGLLARRTRTRDPRCITRTRPAPAIPPACASRWQICRTPILSSRLQPCLSVGRARLPVYLSAQARLDFPPWSGCPSGR